MEISLSRDDSIEEGHFAERSWAGLLSYYLTNRQVELLQKVPSGAVKGNWAMKGILQYRNDKDYIL